MKESELIFGLIRSIGKKEYSYNDIAYLTAPFSVSDTSLRSNISRMVQGNILIVRKEGRQAFYSFSAKSDKLGSNVAYAFRKPDWSAWSGKWWGISISVPEASKKERYRITKKLGHYRFALLHPGLWIRPLNPAEKIEDKLKDIFNSKFCEIFGFTFYSGQDLGRISTLFKLSDIAEQIKECLNNFRTSQHAYNLDIPEEALRARMIEGNKLVRCLALDPMLPDQLLPSTWQGDELRETFFNWDRLTAEKSKPYWIKVSPETRSP